MEPTLVEDTDALKDLCSALEGEEYYAIDTEFHLERTYYPQLALIQVAWSDQVALVDPLAVDPEPLGHIFSGPGVAVVHAAEQDLDVLEAACGVVPTTVFDTQIAAGFLGHSSPSLSRLVDQQLGISLPKTDRLSDWIARPITDRQITYAAGDVAYLLALRSTMATQLAELGRLEWAQEECAAVLRGRRAPAIPEEAWWKVRVSAKSARQVPGGGPRACGMAGTAGRGIQPAPQDHIVGPRALDHLAASTGQPRRALALRGVDERHLARGAGREILAAINRGLELPAAKLHLAPERRDDQAPAAAVAVATGLVRQISENLHFDQSLLASRADITDLLCGEPSRLDVGWRSTLAGEPIRRLMSGQVATVFDTSGVLTLEERSFRPVSFSTQEGTSRPDEPQPSAHPPD